MLRIEGIWERPKPAKDAPLRFKAKAKLGPLVVRYQVSGVGRQAAYSEEMSIRHSQPFLARMQNGVLRIGAFRGISE